MIGVVLWSDQRTGRAVIWCEDNNGLAYLTGREARRFRNAFAVGDILSFNVEDKQSARWVFNAVRLDESWGKVLIDALADDVTNTASDARCRAEANVIEIERDHKNLRDELRQFLSVKTEEQVTGT